jgi:hypothetical protein
LGRNEEALEVIDEALKEMESTWRSNTKLDKYLTRMQEIEKSIEERAAAAKAMEEQEQEASQVFGQEGSDEKQESVGFRVSSTSGAYLLNSEFPEVERAMPTILDVLATMRYHRMRICEALKKDDEAAREGRWLKEFSTKGLSEHF